MTPSAVNVLVALELRTAAVKADAELPRSSWLSDALRMAADALVDPELLEKLA